MMNRVPSLRALRLLPAYDREFCPDLVQDFFIPVLNRAARYDRTTYNMAIPRCEHQSRAREWRLLRGIFMTRHLRI